MNQAVYKDKELYQWKQYFLMILISLLTVIHSQGQTSVDTLKKLLNTTTTDTTKVELYLQLANEYRTKEDSALYYVKKGLEVAENFRDSEQIRGVIIDVVGLSRPFAASNRERIFPYLFLARDYSEKKKNDKFTANIDYSLARNYAYSGESKLALEAIEKSIAYRSKRDTIDEALLAAYNVYCFIQLDLGNYESATEVAIKSLKAAEEQENGQYTSIFLNILSEIYDVQGDLDKGLYYAKRVLKTSIENGMHENRIMAGHITLSDIYNSKYEQSKDTTYLQLEIMHTRKALNLALEHNNEEVIAICYTNMGLYYQDNNWGDSMNYYFNEALPILQKIGNEKTEMMIYISLIKHHYQSALEDKEQNSLATYQQHLLKGREYGERFFASNISDESLDLVHNSTLYLSWIYAELGDYENAYRFLRRHEAVEDSLYDVDRLAIIEETEAKYQTEKKDLEIENLNKEKALQKASNERQQVILYGGAFVLLLLVVFLAIVYRLYQQKQEINQDLEKQNDRIAEQNEEKEILLKEIHHRVKNNLQIISSLLSLQSRKMDNNQAIAAIEDGQNRVKSMALIHHKLYQNEDISVVNFKEYTMQLSDQILDLFQLSKVKVNLSIPADTAFDIDTAIPLGLILNELLTNACKYAFQKEGNKQLDIILTSHENGIYSLEVKDNGVGMPADFDLKKSKSLGLRLVQRLSMQLFGKTTYTSGQGAHFKIQFKDTFLRKEMD